MRSPNLSQVTEGDLKKWIELTGRDWNFSIPLDTEAFTAWRNLPSTGLKALDDFQESTRACICILRTRLAWQEWLVCCRRLGSRWWSSGRMGNLHFQIDTESVRILRFWHRICAGNQWRSTLKVWHLLSTGRIGRIYDKVLSYDCPYGSIPLKGLVLSASHPGGSWIQKGWVPLCQLELQTQEVDF